MKPRFFSITALVLFLWSFDSKAQDNFSSWSDYKYVYVSYTPNTWTKTALSYSAQMTYDAWNHVDQTLDFLKNEMGPDRVLPKNQEDWPEEALENRHRILFIDIWSDGNYVNTGYGPSGTSYAVWRYRDLTHLVKASKNEKYTGNLSLETYSHSMSMGINGDHRNIQKKWKQAHNYDEYSYQGKGEENILNELVKLGYFVQVEEVEPEMVTFNVDSIKTYIDVSGKSCIYGLYRLAPGEGESCGNYRFGVLDIDGEPTAVITKDYDLDNTAWKKGEIKSRFIPTASPNIFIADWKMGNRTETEGYAKCEGGLLTIDIPKVGEEKTDVSCNYIKIYPLSVNSTTSKPAPTSTNIGNAIAAGSAVVIDDVNQYIITNFHVVEDKSSFKVEQGGVLYQANLIKTDEKNDLALLRITGDGIKLKSLPLSIDDRLGDRVYSAGYPRIFQMGDEIKITEGVISSMSFLSDPSRYQTSVPITNGNSGGALLDESGNLVGITQGGWRPDANTENVNAAVKSLYVLSLAQTEATCRINLVQKTGGLEFNKIENSVLPIYVFD